MLLKMLHNGCNVAVLRVLLIYLHSPLGTPLGIMHVYLSNLSRPCYNILVHVVSETYARIKSNRAALTIIFIELV